MLKELQLVHNSTWNQIVRKDLAVLIRCSCIREVRLGLEDSGVVCECGTTYRWTEKPVLTLTAKIEAMYSSEAIDLVLRR